MSETTSRIAGALTADLPTVDIDGTPVHLVDSDDAGSLIAAAAARRGDRPVGVVSINLDHVHHFGASLRARRGLDAIDPHAGAIDWLNLIDGAPIARQTARVTGVAYPKLSGSDLIGPVLDDAAQSGRTVGVIGGSAEVTAALMKRFAADWPGIRFAGHWTPSREDLSGGLSPRIAEEMREQGVDILLVCLGKPRQEQWIAEHGAATGAGVLLAFGAVVDFLAGRVTRAPRWVSESGLEWAWRLMLEPRRLARRYLIQGPPAYLAVRRSAR